MLQPNAIGITRETLVKIEGGRQYIKLNQSRAMIFPIEIQYECLLDIKSNNKRSVFFERTTC